MGKTASGRSKECLARMRKRRRDSQARHRHQLAACYETLRMSVPGVCERMPHRTPSWTRVKSLSKPELLQCSKKYVLHLEEVLTGLLKKRDCAVSPSNTERDNSGNFVSRVIGKFKDLDEFRTHFANRFHLKGDVLSYFQEKEDGSGSESSEAENRYEDQCFLDMTHILLSPGSTNFRHCQTEGSSQSSGNSKGSSQQSLDHGFFSGDGGSQEKSFEKKLNQNSSRVTSGQPRGVQTFGSPFRLQQPSLGAFTNGAFFDTSHLYFYVPATGYPTPFLSPYFPPVLGASFSPVPNRNDDVSDGCEFPGSFRGRSINVPPSPYKLPASAGGKSGSSDKQSYALPREIGIKISDENSGKKFESKYVQGNEDIAGWKGNIQAPVGYNWNNDMML